MHCILLNCCRYETEEEVVTVLNILGYNGYSVVGMASTANR
jgi:hypothetical protein